MSFSKKDDIAGLMQKSILHFDAPRYKLLSWAIMPNHIHFLMRPIENHLLSEIMKNFKSYIAHEANKLLNRSGKFWQEDYFDRYIRNYKHYENTLFYIENNPVKAHLCKKASDWKYGSAYSRSADVSSANVAGDVEESN